MRGRAMRAVSGTETGDGQMVRGEGPMFQMEQFHDTRRYCRRSNHRSKSGLLVSRTEAEMAWGPKFALTRYFSELVQWRVAASRHTAKRQGSTRCQMAMSIARDYIKATNRF